MPFGSQTNVSRESEYDVFGLGGYAKLPSPVDGTTYLYEGSEAELRMFSQDAVVLGSPYRRGEAVYALWVSVPSSPEELCYLMAANGDQLGWADPAEVRRVSRHVELVLDDVANLRTLTTEWGSSDALAHHAGDAFFPTRPKPSFGNRMCYLLFSEGRGSLPVEVPMGMLDDLSRPASAEEFSLFLQGGAIGSNCETEQ